MSLPQSLTVVGSQSLFRHFLPSSGDFFKSAQFLWAAPNNAQEVSAALADGGTLAILVNPEDYDAAVIPDRMDNTLLWFMRPLSLKGKTFLRDAPNLRRAEEKLAQNRQHFIEQISWWDGIRIVVSDWSSYAFCMSRSLPAALSAPPVSDSLFSNLQPDFSTIALWNPGEVSSFSSFFSKGLPPLPILTTSGSESNVTDKPGVAILLDEGISGSFHYEAAVSFSLGQALVSPYIMTRWGFEPGIDFLEYSTPDELDLIVNHLMRNKGSLKLMGFRARQKAWNLRASAVLGRLFGVWGII